jgi:outer membrane receptor for ferrienterochelin and colicin
VLRPIIRSSEGSGADLKTVISDLNVKANFKAGEKDHLYFSFYTGIDKYVSQNEESSWYPPQTGEIRTKNNYGFSWGNITAMSRWNHVYNRKMFGNLTFNYTRFLFDVFSKIESENASGGLTSQVRQKYFSSVRDLSLKYDVDLIPSPEHFIKFGASAILHYYRPGINEHYQKDTSVRLNIVIDNNSLYTGEYDLYAEDDIRISSSMKINAGIRMSGFSAGNRFFSSVQPRFNWLYKWNSNWSLKGSLVKMNQYIHLLTNSNLGLPTDLWLPVTKRIPPQVSYQVSAAVAYSYDKTLEASAEFYYKKLSNVIEYKEGSGFTNSFTNWEDLVETGKGQTYGAEWLVQKKKGKLTGLFSYTLSWSNRRFENINGGKTFPYKFDRRHEIKTAMVWRPVKRFECSAEWLFASGNAISLPRGQYFNPVSNTYVDIYEGRNDFRMPAYHRLDVSFKFMKQRKKYLRTWVVGLYNLYNQQNPFFIYKESNAFLNEVNFRKVSLFPILPSFTYQFKF